MSASERISSALRRLASVTSVARTRREDEARYERHGGVNGELLARTEQAASRLESYASIVERSTL